MKAFLQEGKCVKNTLFSPLRYPSNSLGVCAIFVSVQSFFFFNKIPVKQFWAWAESKTCFIRKYLTIFKFVASSILYKQWSKTNRWELLYTGIWGLSWNFNISCIRNKHETCQLHKYVQHHQSIPSTLLEQCKISGTFQA